MSTTNIVYDLDDPLVRLFEESSLAEEIYDANGNQIRVNKAWCRIWGSDAYPVGTFNALKSSKFYDLGIDQAITAAFEHGEDCLGLEFWINIDDAKPLNESSCLRADIRCVKDQNGTLKNVLIISEDITEKKIAEDNSQIQESLINEGLVFHQKGSVVEINQALRNMLGMEKSVEVKGLHVLEFVADEYHDIVKDKLEKEVIEPYEVVALKVNGDRFPVEVSPGQLFRNGQKTRVASIRDLTQIRNSEEERFLSEERLNLVMQTDDTGHYDWNVSEGLPMKWDRNMKALFGLNPNENHEDYGAIYNQMLHEEDQERVIQQCLDAMKADNPDSIFKEEFRIRSLDQKIKHVEAVTRVFRKPNGEVTRIIGACRDITDRKLMEIDLKKSEERFRELANLLPVAVFESKVDSTITYANRASFELFDVSEEVFNKGLRGIDLIHESDKQRLQDLLSRNLSGMGQGASKFLVRGMNGSIKPILMYFSPIEHEGIVTGIRGVGMDITLQVEAQEKVKDQNEKLLTAANDLAKSNQELKQALAEAQKSKELEMALTKLKEAQAQLIDKEKMASIGILTAGVAHEVNNPLNFIRGGALVANEHLKEHHPDVLKELLPYFEMIDTGVNRASQIVNSLNRFNRKSERMNERCNVHEILDNCLTILNNSLKHKVEIQKNYSKQACFTLGNEGQLHQVFLNIISNAEQAINDKGIIEIETKVSTNTITIYIRDNGEGIQESDLQKVMEPFYTTKSPGLGTGLGMSLSNSIIQEHKGKIKYYSTAGEGTQVEIKLQSLKEDTNE